MSITRDEIEWKINFLEDEIAELNRETEELEMMLEESEEKKWKILIM